MSTFWRWMGTTLVVAGLMAGSTGCSSESDDGPGVEPVYYQAVDVLVLERREAMGSCFEPDTAQRISIDRRADPGTIGGTVFTEGVEGQDECLAHNTPSEVCVVVVEIANTPLTADEGDELASLVTALPHGECQSDPDYHVDPCITTSLTLDGSREAHCLGGTQLVEGHGAALSALFTFIDELALSKL